jgi:hypothetical protein
MLAGIHSRERKQGKMLAGFHITPQLVVLAATVGTYFYLQRQLRMKPALIIFVLFLGMLDSVALPQVMVYVDQIFTKL